MPTAENMTPNHLRAAIGELEAQWHYIEGLHPGAVTTIWLEPRDLSARVNNALRGVFGRNSPEYRRASVRKEDFRPANGRRAARQEQIAAFANGQHQAMDKLRTEIAALKALLPTHPVSAGFDMGLGFDTRETPLVLRDQQRGGRALPEVETQVFSPPPVTTLITPVPEDPQQVAPVVVSAVGTATGTSDAMGVGRVISANRLQIELASASLLLFFENKLAELRAKRPNSSEAKLEVDEQIAEYATHKQNLGRLRLATAAFSEAPEKETEAVKASLTFARGIQSWWTKSHEKICSGAFDMALFVAGVTVCSLAGSGGQLAVAVSGVLAGGRPVIDAIRAVASGRSRSGDMP
jgi:hypothetical protein